MTVLHRDEHLLIVNKPPGLLAQPDHTGDPDVVSRGKEMLADTAAGTPFLGPVHRLDRPSSGVMALARSSEAARHLSRQFRERLVEKRYVVVVEGTLRGIGVWTDYIAKTDRQPRLVDPDDPDGKRAELNWQVLESNSARTLLQVTLQTGRSHQIRLQAASRGHPVVGDDRYGASAALTKRVIALHHVLLRVDHPARPRRESFVAAPPAHWSEVLTDAMDSTLRRMLDREQPG